MTTITLKLEAPDDLKLHHLGKALGRLGCRILSTPVQTNPERHGNANVVRIPRHRRQPARPWPPQGPEAA